MTGANETAGDAGISWHASYPAGRSWNNTGKGGVAGLTFKFSVAANLRVIVSDPSANGREMRDGLKI